MYRLVITEKPSVAMSIAKVLGATARREGHMEGCGSPVATSKRQRRLDAPTEPEARPGGWLVSWCVSHLAGLAEPAAYDPRYDKWRREDLPILLENWRFTIGRDKREQFDVLRTLLRREDVSEVVNACDAGLEGEQIFRTAYHLAGCTKPMKRLWISSMEDSAIREGGFRQPSLRPRLCYDGLHQAALCRMKADWLVGINATRLFSVLYGRTLNIGRVMPPTLALIAQREAEIAAFEPVPFYTVELICGGMAVSGERIAAKEDAAAIASTCGGGTTSVQTVERSPERVTPAVRGQRMANERIRALNEEEKQFAAAAGYELELIPEKYIWIDDLRGRIKRAAAGAVDEKEFAQRLRLDGVELVPQRDKKTGELTYRHRATRTQSEHYLFELVDTSRFPDKIPQNLKSKSHKLGNNCQPDSIAKMFRQPGQHAPEAPKEQMSERDRINTRIKEYVGRVLRYFEMDTEEEDELLLNSASSMALRITERIQRTPSPDPIMHVQIGC